VETAIWPLVSPSGSVEIGWADWFDEGSRVAVLSQARVEAPKRGIVVRSLRQRTSEVAAKPMGREEDDVERKS
jgi:hypothetical protein